MASLVGKRRGGRTSYYLVESARVAGKPRIVAQQYLGSAEEVAARLGAAGPGAPARTRHRAFGDLAAAWSVLERLEVVAIIDQVVGRRRADAAASVGTYLALAALNRVVAPRSKLAFAAWWRATAGDRLVKLPAAALDHRRFWDAMDQVSVADLRAIERTVAARMVEVFGLDLAGLVLDMTNFATFVDSANQRNTIAARGHAKQKRFDLRLVGVGLVVTSDGGVPILSHAYQGNRPDVTQFSAVIDELVVRFGALARATDRLTVVYDAGCDSTDSTDGQADVEAARCTCRQPAPKRPPRPAGHPRPPLPRGGRRALPGADRAGGSDDGVGRPAAGRGTHSESFHTAQARGFEQTLAKARRRLAELQARLARGKTRRPAPPWRPRSARSLRPLAGPRVGWELRGEQPASLRLSWRTDPAAKRRLAAEVFGKRILFTDHEDWPVDQVVAAYRSKPTSRRAFASSRTPRSSPSARCSTGPTRRSGCTCSTACSPDRGAPATPPGRPGRPWDERAGAAGHLAGIQETVLLYQGARGRPRARHVLTEMDPVQQRLFDLFDLAAYAPRR